MPYEQIQSGIQAEQDKRKRLQAAILKSMGGMGDTQMVSGRAVQNSPITGISKIIEALINKNAIGSSQEETDRLLAQQESEKSAAIDDVMKQYSGAPQEGGPLRYQEGQDYQEISPEVEADPVKAALLAASSPYTKDMSSIISAQGKSSNPYYKPVYGEGGEILTFDARTGTMTPTDYVAGKFDPTTQGNVAAAKEQGKQDVNLEMTPQIAAATDIAERGAEKTINRPKIEKDIAGQEVKFEMLDKSINEAKEMAKGWTTTGFLAQMTSGIGGTPAHDLQSKMDTVKSNIGFDRLQEMRDNSPTGGALGQVSEMENKLLQSVWGALNQSQSEEAFIQNLDAVNAQTKESWARILAAYEKDYGVPYGVEDKEEVDDEAAKEARYQAWKAKQ